MRAWLNGRLLAAEAAHISPFDRGLLLGDGLFETIPVHRGRPFDLDAHLARLEHGLDVLGFAAAVDLAAVRRGVAAYLAAEKVESAVLRLTVTRGVGPRGLAPPADPQPSVLMTWSPLPPQGAAPIHAIVAAATRRNEFSPLSRIKALPYLDNLIALREARERGADEALLLNTQGKVACASIANVFAVAGRRLLTPPVADGALPGTMRANVLALAAGAGLDCLEQSLAPPQLAAADGVFLTNSVRGILEVQSLDGKELRRTAPAILSRLRELAAARMAAA